MVSTVQFGTDGVIHNHGLPKLTKYEMELFQEAVQLLKRREEQALNFLNKTECPAGANLMSSRAARRNYSSYA